MDTYSQRGNMDGAISPANLGTTGGSYSPNSLSGSGAKLAKTVSTSRVPKIDRTQSLRTNVRPLGPYNRSGDPSSDVSPSLPNLQSPTALTDRRFSRPKGRQSIQAPEEEQQRHFQSHGVHVRLVSLSVRPSVRARVVKPALPRLAGSIIVHTRTF